MCGINQGSQAASGPLFLFPFRSREIKALEREVAGAFFDHLSPKAHKLFSPSRFPGPLPRGRPALFQAGDAFDVGRVGKEIEGLDGQDVVLILEEGQVPGQGGGVARNIDDAPGGTAP